MGSLPEFSLAGRAALVTGAGNGIGRATALRLAAMGATVGVNDLKPEFVERTLGEIAAAGGRGLPVVQNIATREGMRHAVLGFAEAAGGLHVLVNNAAWVRYQAVPDIAPETLERMLDVGFKAVIWGIQAAAEVMQSGSIVNIASVAGLRSAPSSIVYSGIKSGVMGVTRAAAAELGAKGIRVNAIAPSAVPTEGTQRNRNAERDAKRIAGTPLGRLGTVDDIARAVCFLASDQASFITGQVLVVDGGTTTTIL